MISSIIPSFQPHRPLKRHKVAYKWFDISRRIEFLDGLWQRDQVEKEMTADQISEAERLSEDWMEQKQ